MIEANEVNSTFYALRLLWHGLDISQIEVTGGEEYPGSEFTKEEQEQALEIIHGIEELESLSLDQLSPDKISFYLTTLADRIENLANSDLANAGYAVETTALSSEGSPETDEKPNAEAMLQLELEGDEQLRQSEKLEAIGQLASGVAHDFNNLLTAIDGYSSLALRQLGDDHPTSSYLEEISKAGDRASNLTRQLLAFGRKQLLQPLALNLNDVVGDMIKLLKRLIGEDVQLVTKPGADLKQIKADPGQLEQVLVNLVVNARDAMPRGGTVTIETANTTLDGAYAGRHIGVTPGEYVMLAISDTGTGMDHDTKARIFEPFFTTKEKGKGTGLGLSTVYGIIKQSGGGVWVYSELGKGTTFKVYLPQVEDEASAREHSKADEAIKRGTETVLLVEDEDMVRNLASELLEESGYVVLSASGGEEAINFGKKHNDRIDLLITDVVMPKISGKEVAEQLKKIHPETKVLFMSGYTDEAIVQQGIVDSDIAFIQKPFSERALTQMVRDVLDAKTGNA
jgi:signal transduction histidine kinase/ActR/RegA family two-component response regulator